MMLAMGLNRRFNQRVKLTEFGSNRGQGDGVLNSFLDQHIP